MVWGVAMEMNFYGKPVLMRMVFGRGVSTHITYAVRDSGWSSVDFAAR
jgi:hypothetical protein